MVFFQYTKKKSGREVGLFYKFVNQVKIRPVLYFTHK